MFRYLRWCGSEVYCSGIYVGAVVKRGPDWDWDNQDGGEEGSTATGTVTCIRGWDQESAVSLFYLLYLYFSWERWF